MTGATGAAGGGSGLPTGVGPREPVPTRREATGRPSSWGEAGPALLTLVTPGGAPVCEGDSCFVPGAEGDWSEVPD